MDYSTICEFRCQMEKVVMIKCGGYVLCLALGHVFNTILGAAFVTFIG